MSYKLEKADQKEPVNSKEIIKEQQYNTLPWIEKYRPQTFDEIISHTHIVQTLKNFITNKCLPHLLFYGPPGTGKTSIINVCAKELYQDEFNLMVLEINASEERGIEVVRTRISQFVTTKNVFCSKPDMFKLVILDEADAMTSDAQAMLRRVIEKYTKNTRFCLICNYIKKINIALQSRCTKFRFAPLNEKYIEVKTREIIQTEKINVTNGGLNTIIKRSGGDMRRILNILQSTSMAYDEIDEDSVNNCIGYPSSVDINKIFDSFMNDSFYNSSKLIEQFRYNKGYSLIDIINELYNKLTERILMNDGQNKESELKIIQLMADVEFHIASCTSETLQLAAVIGIFKLVKENGIMITPSIA